MKLNPKYLLLFLIPLSSPAYSFPMFVSSVSGGLLPIFVALGILFFRKKILLYSVGLYYLLFVALNNSDTSFIYEDFKYEFDNINIENINPNLKSNNLNESSFRYITRSNDLVLDDTPNIKDSPQGVSPISARSYEMFNMGQLLNLPYGTRTSDSYYSKLNSNDHTQDYGEYEIDKGHIMVLFDEVSTLQNMYSHHNLTKVFFIEDLMFNDTLEIPEDQNFIIVGVNFREKWKIRTYKQTIHDHLTKRNIRYQSITSKDDIYHNKIKDLHFIKDFKSLIGLDRPFDQGIEPNINIFSGTDSQYFCNDQFTFINLSKNGDYQVCNSEHIPMTASLNHINKVAEYLRIKYADSNILFTVENRIDLYYATALQNILSGSSITISGAYLMESESITLSKLEGLMIQHSTHFAIVLLSMTLIALRQRSLILSAVVLSIGFRYQELLLNIYGYNYVLSSVILLLLVALLPNSRTISSKSDGLNFLKSLNLNVPRFRSVNFFNHIKKSDIGQYLRSNSSNESMNSLRSGFADSHLITKDNINTVKSLVFSSQKKNFLKTGGIVQEFIDADRYGNAIINCTVNGQPSIIIETSDTHENVTSGHQSKKEYYSVKESEFTQNPVLSDCHIISEASKHPCICEFAIKDGTVYWLQYQKMSGGSHSITEDIKNTYSHYEFGYDITNNDLSSLQAILLRPDIRVNGQSLYIEKSNILGLYKLISFITPLSLIEWLSRKSNSLNTINILSLLLRLHPSNERVVTDGGFITYRAINIANNLHSHKQSLLKGSEIYQSPFDFKITSEEISFDLIINDEADVERLKNGQYQHVLINNQIFEILDYIDNSKIFYIPDSKPLSSHFCLVGRELGINFKIYRN